MARFNWDCGLTKKIILLVFTAVMVGLVYFLATRYTAQIHKCVVISSHGLTEQEQKPMEEQPQSDTHSLRYREQRNNLSRELNLMKKAYGQQSCDQLKILMKAGKSVNSRVSENGGWCSEVSRPNSSEHKWDKKFSTALSTFLKGKTVASFGDGPGMYKKHIDSLGEVISYTAYDGAPFCEEVTDGVVKFLDLSAPQYGLPAFDWVVSVEVGEHIPAKYESIYLNNLVRHAEEGIILSWAVPGQGGLSHVNNKALGDVVTQMNERGFDIDKKAGEPIQSAATFIWLKTNVNVYYRKDKKSFIPDNA